MKEEPHEVVKNQDAVDRKELERLRGVYSELKPFIRRVDRKVGETKMGGAMRSVSKYSLYNPKNAGTQRRIGTKTRYASPRSP